MRPANDARLVKGVSPPSRAVSCLPLSAMDTVTGTDWPPRSRTPDTCTSTDGAVCSRSQAGAGRTVTPRADARRDRPGAGVQTPRPSPSRTSPWKASKGFFASGLQSTVRLRQVQAVSASRAVRSGGSHCKTARWPLRSSRWSSVSAGRTTSVPGAPALRFQQVPHRGDSTASRATSPSVRDTWYSKTATSSRSQNRPVQPRDSACSPKRWDRWAKGSQAPLTGRPSSRQSQPSPPEN